MKINWLIPFMLMSIVFSPMKVMSGEIEVKKQILNEKGEIEESTLEHIVRVSKGNRAEFKDTVVELKFDKSRGEFEKSVYIGIKNAADKYKFCNFDAKIPFYQENTNIDFVLFGHTIIPGSRRDIKELRATDPNKLGAEELFRYYAKSQIQASYVLNNVLSSDEFSRDNVRSVYSFLQAINNLASKRYIQPDRLAKRSATWLSEACKNSKSVCSNAVGASNWKQALTEFDAIEAYRYEKLYDEILGLRTVDFDAYCEIMVSLQDSFEKMQDDEVLRINRRKITAQVASAVAGCYAKAAWGVGFKDAFKGQDKDEVLKKQMLNLERQLSSEVVKASQWPGLSSQLKGHKQDLENLLSR